MQQEEEAGLGGGVGKGEVLHHAWALKAKASRARSQTRGHQWSKQALSLSSVAACVLGLTHTHSLQDSGGLYHLPAQASELPGLELPSSDESSQSSSLLCVTQSRGPGNLESRACLCWGEPRRGGPCPPRVQLCHRWSPRHGAPRRREWGGPAGQAEKFGSAAPISYHGRVLLSSSHSLPHTHLESG